MRKTTVLGLLVLGVCANVSRAQSPTPKHLTTTIVPTITRPAIIRERVPVPVTGPTIIVQQPVYTQPNPVYLLPTYSPFVSNSRYGVRRSPYGGTYGRTTGYVPYRGYNVSQPILRSSTPVLRSSVPVMRSSVPVMRSSVPAPGVGVGIFRRP